MKRKFLLVTVILISLGILLVVTDNQQTADPESSNRPIVLGGAFAQSGFAASWGEADFNGATLAIEDLNDQGYQVQLDVADTKSMAKDTISAVTKLFSNPNTKVVIGSTWLDSFVGAATIAERSDKIVISPSASITAVNKDRQYKGVYSTWYRSDQQVVELGKRLSDEHNSVAVIRSDDPFWEDSTQYLQDELGNKLVNEVVINPESTDVKSDYLKLTNSSPDAIFFGFSSEANLYSFLKTSSPEWGFDTPLYYRINFRVF